MHLTDEQLFDLNKENSSITHQHISKCEFCKQRISNLFSFREKLNEDTHFSINTNHWPSLQAEFVAQHGVKKQTLLKSKIKRLQISLAAIAATLIIFLLVPAISNNQTNLLEQQLSELIDENNQLQQMIHNTRLLSYEKNVSNEITQILQSNNLNIEIEQLDSQIQLSYLEENTISEKIKLWKQRKNLLLQSINDPSPPPRRTI
ncbi:MAG: hypothetical protein KUG78_00670 [Kangiellaceae bacterium]|nr:hypothetical protein [Kangiellaceae bacterium]